MTTPHSAQLSSERLALLYELSRTFNSSLDLDEVLNRVMDEVITVMRAERGFVMLGDSKDELVFRVARGLDQQIIEDPEFQISRGIVQKVAREGQSLLTSDAQIDSRFSSRQSVMSLGLRSILCVPLKIKDQVTGVIYIDNRLQAGIFTQDHLELLSAIASNAAIAIENARLYQIAVEKGRMERELQMARQVQNSLLPKEAPRITGWEFATYWQPAREVSGDYYDFIESDDGNIGLVVADVTGKGMPASLFMVFTRSVVRASIGENIALPNGIARANRLICLESDQGLFVTLFFGFLNLTTGELNYVNSGHNPALFYRQDEDRVLNLIRTGMPLGIDESAQFEGKSLQLQPGDFLLIYTDGVTEAVNESGEEFGVDRLIGLVYEHRHDPVQGILDAINRTHDHFVGVNTPFDDTTILIAKRCEEG